MKFNKLYTLLSEANVNSLVPLFQKEFLRRYSNRFATKSYNDLNDSQKQELNNYIISMKSLTTNIVKDITTNPQYQSWIFELVKNEYLVLPEDIEKTKDLLKKFDKVKKSENFKDSKDILTYETFGQLHKVVKEFIDKNKSFATLNLGNNNVIYNKGEFKVVELVNFKDAFPLLDDTGWCVQHEEYWNDYKPPYYLILKNNKQYALAHINSNQLKDVHDDEFIPENVTKEFYDAVIYILNYKEVKERPQGDFVPVLINYINDDNYIKEILEIDASYIRYIKNPSIELQKKVLDMNFRNIEDIKNPDRNLITDHIIKYPFTIKYINDPDRELQLLAVKKSPTAIEYIKNPDRSVIMYIITKFGDNYIDNINNIPIDIQKSLVERDPINILKINGPDKEALNLAIKLKPKDVFIDEMRIHFDEIEGKYLFNPINFRKWMSIQKADYINHIVSRADGKGVYEV